MKGKEKKEKLIMNISAQFGASFKRKKMREEESKEEEEKKSI